MSSRGRISSFSVLLVTAVAVIIGLASAGLLKVQYSPLPPERSLTASFSMKDASPYAVEMEATAVLEGVLSRIPTVTSCSSVSYEGAGSVTVTFGRGTDMAQARLEVASAIRNVYESLPPSVSYPSLSLSSTGEKTRTAVSFTIKGDMPSLELEQYVEDHLYIPIVSIEGVDHVDITGGTPYRWVVTFDSQKARLFGIGMSELSRSITEYFGESFVGTVIDGESSVVVRLKGSGHSRVLSPGSSDFDDIPVRSVEGRIVRLGDIASCSYRESVPTSYFRVNGLNTVALSVGVDSDASMLQTVAKVKSVMHDLESIFPDSVSASVSYDASSYIAAEIEKIVRRTLLCLLILLLLVALTSRSLKYTAVMALTLSVNIAAAIAIYVLLGIRIHVYSLAGMTVSLGIIIDSSIIMVDHYTRHRDRRAFAALLSAVLTTVASLLVVLLLPDKEKAMLVDFIYVIATNLTVSLLVAYLFVPALLDTLDGMPVRRRGLSPGRAGRLLDRNRRYASYIRYVSSHKWMLVTAMVIAFGIPTFLLPEPKSGEEDRTRLQKAYAWLVKDSAYGRNRADVDKVTGTSFALFHKALGRSNFYREPASRILWIHASMPEGCSISQLDEVVRSMENYLALFDEISVYTTSISSSTSADIEVRFKPEFEYTSFPDRLKAEATSMAINFGGANWRIAGVNDSYFNNNVSAVYRMSCITLSGYNYSELMAYADQVLKMVESNKRVSAPLIQGGRRDVPSTQFSLDYDFESMLIRGINPYDYYGDLRAPLYDSDVTSLAAAGRPVEVVLQSDARDSLDLWHIMHTPVGSGGRETALAGVGDIVKRQTGFPIRKMNQSYEVNICYDFIGNYQLESKMAKEVVDHMNQEVLPVGFKASSPSYGWSQEGQRRYIGLVLLIVLVIFIICSICFESLRMSLAVISLVPFSFIGVFLVFGLSRLTFDQGGFAALVMLSGICVNAGIYILFHYMGYNGHCRGMCMPSDRNIRRYIRSFNAKMGPILMTVASTVLGLVPFLFEGPKEVFWFDFALATMAGMLFSIVAIVFLLPAFLFSRHDKI